MSWAASAIAGLSRGETVRVRPRGNSMTPRIRSGQEVELAPVTDPSALSRGDVVLVRVGGRVVLHLVSQATRERLLITNARGRANGWVPRSSVAGRLMRVL